MNRTISYIESGIKNVTHSRGYPQLPSIRLPLSPNTSKLLFIQAYISGDSIEFPVIGFRSLSNVPWDIVEASELTIGTIIDSRMMVVKSPTKFIRDIFNTYDDLRLKSNNKGLIYNSGYGIILDSNNVPLLLVTAIGNIYRRHERVIRTGTNFYIHPKVFRDTKNVVNKHIINTVIPFAKSPAAIEGLNNHKVSVIVEDMSHMLRFPQEPNMNSDEEINMLLNNRIDGLLNTIMP